MEKLFIKDKILREKILKTEKKIFILKCIFKNLNFFELIRWKAFLKFNQLSLNSNKNALLDRCLLTKNKKKFNKFTNFSRHVFLKLIRSGQIYGVKKSSW